MVPRIEWSPDGRRVLVAHRGQLQQRMLDGEVVRTLPVRSIQLGPYPNANLTPNAVVSGTYLDARWCADGRIFAIDRFGFPVMFTMQGQVYGSVQELPTNPSSRAFGMIAANGASYVVYERQLELLDVAGKRTWHFETASRWYPSHRSAVPIAGALSADGRAIAIGLTHHTGHGWLVLDVTPKAKPERFSGTWRAEVVAFDWRAAPLPGLPLRCVLDGARRVHEQRADADCIAVDASGIRVAHGIGPSVRVDYLDANASVTIEPGIERVVALAFGPDDRIACLGDDGTIEIAPIP